MNNWQRCWDHENLDHFLEEGVDEVFSAAEVTTLNEVVGLLAPSTGGSVHLEGPQEVGGVPEKTKGESHVVSTSYMVNKLLN